MRGHRAVKLLSLLFIAAVLAAAVVFNIAKPRVMILHSYRIGYSWTRDVNVGIRRVTDEWSGYSTVWHYMDTKKHTDPGWLRHAGIVARRAIDRFDPDVLISVDDLAQKLAARYYVDHPRMQIVFAGVNGRAKTYGYDKATNVTGIFERKPLEAVKELIQTIEERKEHPSASPSILYLMDTSPSMALDRNLVEDFDWGAIRFVGSIVAENFIQWKTIVNDLKRRGVDYLMVANYRQLPRSDVDPSVPPPREIMGWTEAQSPVPVIGVNIFNVEDGGAIAIGASPFEQGEVAARIAETLIERGLPGRDIPMKVNDQYIVAIDQKALKRRKLRLPQIYETFARTTSTYIGDGQ